jgi:hypothetical protein
MEAELHEIFLFFLNLKVTKKILETANDGSKFKLALTSSSS